MPGIDNDQQNRIKHFKLTQVSSQVLIRKKSLQYIAIIRYIEVDSNHSLQLLHM